MRTVSKRNDSGPERQIQAKNRRALLQDIALLIFLVGLLAAALVVCLSSSDVQRQENVVMFLIMGGAILLAAYKFRYLSMVAAGVQTCFYAIYRIYSGLINGQTVALSCYLWLGLPVLCVGAMLLFMQSTYQAEVISEMLEKQIRDQVLTDPITGLYNLKSMYMDLERQIAYSRRNGLKLTLMLIELRYPQELQSILTAAQFDELRVGMAQELEDLIRIEDRLYALDEDGSMGIICTCDKPGAEVMRRRIQDRLSRTDKFQVFLRHTMRIDLRFGIYEYSEGEIENAMELKKKAENEMQYDV